ncbi:MAG: AAA family ATPase [Methylocystis sp.]|nr:AAA family ATPase [Methylocystis sp.]
MSAQGLLPLYNQDRVDDATFIANFVARHAEFDSLLASLHANAKGGAARHEIIVGARGMGKTSLLRRIAIAIGADAELSRIFVPLRFREEQYNVISLGAFWRNCCDALAEWCEKAARLDLAKRLDAAIAAGDAGTLEAAFLDVCTTLGRRAVLLLDNLDLILDNLKEDNWRLRSVLQSARGPIVIGAATHFLAQSGDRGAPFYEFFHPHILEPLGEKELLACLRALAGARGEKGAAVFALLAKEPERALALYALTGGNPRILALIYQLLERADSHEIFADLEALLDQVTPFYKARVEEYTGANQRAVIDAVALNWDPISSGEIAAATSIAVTSISSILDRLKRDGFIEEVQGSGVRAKYQLAERFLNIWYLMRHGTRQTRQRLRWLTMLLARLFSESELERMARDGERMAGVWRQEWCDAVREAHAEVIRASEERILNSDDRLQEIASKVVGPQGNDVRELLIKALRSIDGGDLNNALGLLDEVIVRFDASATAVPQEVVAHVLFGKGVGLQGVGRTEEGIAVYDDLIARFGMSEAPALQEQCARALLNKGVSLWELGRAEEALVVYGDLIARFGASEARTLRQHVARALNNKGVTLGELGRAEEEIAVYDDLIARFGASEAPALQYVLALAMFGKGFALAESGRVEEGIAVYDELIKRFGESDVSTLQEIVADALAGKGGALRQLGRVEEELAVYADLIARLRGDESPALQERLARALFHKGVALCRLGCADEAIAIYDESIMRFGASESLALREQLARTLFNKGATLAQSGREEEGLLVYDDVITRFGASDAPTLQEAASRALINKGALHWRLGHADEALVAYDDVIARCGGAEAPEMQEQFPKALIGKGFVLEQLDRGEQALMVYDDLIERFEASQDPALRELLAQAFNGKGRLLADHLGRQAEAEAAYGRGVALAPEDDILRANLAWLLLETDRARDAEQLIAELSTLAPDGRALLDAGREIAADNFGSGVAHLCKALETQLEQGESPFFEDLLRLLRLAAARGFGERLLEWFKESGNADRYAPVYGALVAKVRGEQYLRDLNPEVRRFAEKFYDFLSRPKKEEPPAKKPRRSTRRRR